MVASAKAWNVLSRSAMGGTARLRRAKLVTGARPPGVVTREAEQNREKPFSSKLPAAG